MGDYKFFNVGVAADKAALFSSSEKNKKGRPIMKPTGTSFKKGDHFTVDATIKMSVDDTGDGIIHADGGKKYYYLGNDGSVFVGVDDVAKTAVANAGNGVRVYTVDAGDTLSGIAQRFYNNGDKAHYMVIFNANTNILKKPEEIFPGQKLIIPKM